MEPPESVGESVARYRDDAGLIGEFVFNTVYLVSAIAFATVAAIVMLRTDVRITLLVFAPLLIVVGVSRFAFRLVGKFHDAVQSSTAKITGLIGDVFGMVESIKVSHGESGVEQQFDMLCRGRLSAVVRNRLFSQLLNTFSSAVTMLATCAIILAGARSMRAGTFSVGDFALFIYYVEYVSQVVFQIGGALALYKRTGVSLGRLAFLLDDAPPADLTKPAKIALRDNVVPTEPVSRSADHLELLETKALSFIHPSTGNGVFNISISIPRGSFVVMTGRVASGKTTFLRTLLGLLPADSGEVLWNGHVLDDLGGEMVPPRVAYTPQVAKLFDDTVRNNILLGLEGDTASLNRAIVLAVLDDDVKNLASGLDTVVGSKGVKFSGGQKQRAAAARMFVREPELLVCDDLSSALDIETERLLWERVREHRVRHNATFLVVSHRKEALKQADQVILLNGGTIEACGPLSDLLRDSPIMQAIWHGDIGDSEGAQRRKT